MAEEQRIGLWCEYSEYDAMDWPKLVDLNARKSQCEATVGGDSSNIPEGLPFGLCDMVIQESLLKQKMALSRIGCHCRGRTKLDEATKSCRAATFRVYNKHAWRIFHASYSSKGTFYASLVLRHAWVSCCFCVLGSEQYQCISEEHMITQTPISSALFTYGLCLQWQ